MHKSSYHCYPATVITPHVPPVAPPLAGELWGRPAIRSSNASSRHTLDSCTSDSAGWTGYCTRRYHPGVPSQSSPKPAAKKALSYSSKMLPPNLYNIWMSIWWGSNKVLVLGCEEGKNDAHKLTNAPIRWNRIFKVIYSVVISWDSLKGIRHIKQRHHTWIGIIFTIFIKGTHYMWIEIIFIVKALLVSGSNLLLLLLFIYFIYNTLSRTENMWPHMSNWVTCR